MFSGIIYTTSFLRISISISISITIISDIKMPTWELKIEKGQKKECRMVNLRLQDCETQISNFDTET